MASPKSIPLYFGDPLGKNDRGKIFAEEKRFFLYTSYAWQKRNADVLPDAHWVGGNPWTGSKAEVYGWAAWNGTKSSLALRNGANDAQTFTFTLHAEEDGADTSRDQTATITVRQRRSVEINGVKVLDGFNLAKECSEGTAVVKKFIVNVSDGKGLNISFIARKGQPVLNAVRIYRNY